MTQRLGISLPDDLYEEIQELKGEFKVSKICQEALKEAIKLARLCKEQDFQALKERLKR